MTMAKKKSASVQRGQVKLREKKLKDGSSSLYLDINVGGKRHKEYLKLYQVVPTTAQEREQNRQALAAHSTDDCQNIQKSIPNERAFNYNENSRMPFLIQKK